MTKTQDFRFSDSFFKTLIGKKFIKYKCDAFDYTNSVTGIVGLYIENKIYRLLNQQTSIQYFDSEDDVSIWTITETNESNIHSVFENTSQIETPINQTIKKITLVNEHQIVKINKKTYDVWVTRAIIFHLETKDIYFEKDNTAFSEEIEIKRGYDLIKDFPKQNEYFLGEWENGIVAQVENEFVTIE